MKKTIIIAILAIACTVLAFYGQHQRVLHQRAERATEVQERELEQCLAGAEELQRRTQEALEEARRQKEIAKDALKEAQFQFERNDKPQ